MPRVYSDLHHSMLRLGRVLQSTADTRYARKSELHPKDVVPGRGGADGLWQSRRFCDVGERSALPPTAIISCTAANRRDVPGPDLSGLPLIQNTDSIILKNSIIGACQSWSNIAGGRTCDRSLLQRRSLWHCPLRRLRKATKICGTLVRT